MNPLPPLISLLGIAAGVFGALQLAAWGAPDLPPADVDPGVSIEEERAVNGGDPESYFHPGPLSQAIAETEEQFEAGAEDVTNVTIEPATVRVNQASGANTLPLSELPVDAPERMIDGINELRQEANSGPVTLDDVKYFSWSTANPTSEEWYVLLDIVTAGPPTEFVANRDGSRVRFRGG